MARLSAQGRLSSLETNGELEIGNLCFHISKNTFGDKQMRKNWGISLIRGRKGLQGCQVSSRHSTSPFECRVLDVLDNNSPHTALSKQSSSPQCNPARVSPKHGANLSRATPQVTNVHLRPPSAAIVPRYLTERFGPYI